MFRTLLICGSRKTIPAMLDKVLELVTKAQRDGYFIICGDAGGIDSAVMVAACNLGILHKVFGVTELPRNVCCPYHALEAPIYQRVPGNYLARDRYMVSMADRVIGICLNQSRGTVYTCTYAGKVGKPVGVLHYTRRP